MSSKHNGSPIPRHYLFVLRDGSVVVQWVAQKVQEIHTGTFRPYSPADYSHPITDSDLDQLQAQGHVSHYTSRYIWLLPIDQPKQPGNGGNAHRIRAFYIMTTLPAKHLDAVASVLSHLPGLPETEVRVHDEKVAVNGLESNPFRTLQDAQEVLQALQQAAPGMFRGSFVAVFEMALGRQVADANVASSALWPGVAQLAQTDTTVTAHKTVMMVGNAHPEQKDPLQQMLQDEMGMTVIRCEKARQAIPLLEDNPPTVAIVDLNMPDLHGWAFIRDVREIRSLMDLRFIVLSDNSKDEVFALKVAKVAGFFAYPLNLRILREKLWLLLRDVEVDNSS